MLKESEHVRQDPGQPRRRWFRDEELDLVVWIGPAGAAIGFELCYGDPRDGQLAVTWTIEDGFTHSIVDSGDATPFENRAPQLIAAGEPPFDALLGSFRARATAIDPPIARFVMDKLRIGATPSR